MCRSIDLAVLASSTRFGTMNSGLIVIEPESRSILEDDVFLHPLLTFLIDIWRRIRMELTVEVRHFLNHHLTPFHELDFSFLC